MSLTDQIKNSSPADRRQPARKSTGIFDNPGDTVAGVVKEIKAIDSDYQQGVPLVVLESAEINGKAHDEDTLDVPCWHAGLRYGLGEVAQPGDQVLVTYQGPKSSGKGYDYEVVVVPSTTPKSNTDLPVTEPTDSITAAVERAEGAFG